MLKIRVNAMHDYLIFDKIGSGTFSTVYLVQKKHPKDKSRFAMKVMKDKFRSIDEIQKTDEVQIMNLLGSHENIVSLQDIIFEPKRMRLSLVLDLMDMSLLDLIAPDNPYLSVRECLRLTYQLLRALSYIHSKGFIHRDVKPENCLVQKNTMNLKLADFGSSRRPSKNSNMTEYIATRWYRPPECLLTSGEYGTELDIWAVGCVLYEMYTKQPLFPGQNTIDQLQKIHQIIGVPDDEQLSRVHMNNSALNNFDFTVDETTESNQNAFHGLKYLLPNVSDVVIDLLCCLLAYLPENRITASEALNHPAFDDIRAEFQVEQDELQMDRDEFESSNQSKDLYPPLHLKKSMKMQVPPIAGSAPVMSPVTNKRKSGGQINYPNFHSPQKGVVKPGIIHKQTSHRQNYENLIMNSTTKQAMKKNAKIIAPKSRLEPIHKPPPTINMYKSNLQSKMKSKSVLGKLSCLPAINIHPL